MCTLNTFKLSNQTPFHFQMRNPLSVSADQSIPIYCYWLIIRRWKTKAATLRELYRIADGRSWGIGPGWPQSSWWGCRSRRRSRPSRRTDSPPSRTATGGRNWKRRKRAYLLLRGQKVEGGGEEEWRSKRWRQRERWHTVCLKWWEKIHNISVFWAFRVFYHFTNVTFEYTVS